MSARSFLEGLYPPQNLHDVTELENTIPFKIKTPVKDVFINEIPIHPIDSQDDYLLEIYNPETCPYMRRFEHMGDGDLADVIDPKFIPLI